MQCLYNAVSMMQTVKCPLFYLILSLQILNTLQALGGGVLVQQGWVAGEKSKLVITKLRKGGVPPPTTHPKKHHELLFSIFDIAKRSLCIFHRIMTMFAAP